MSLFTNIKFGPPTFYEDVLVTLMWHRWLWWIIGTVLGLVAAWSVLGRRYSGIRQTAEAATLLLCAIVSHRSPPWAG